jgi:hypothetical protein
MIGWLVGEVKKQQLCGLKQILVDCCIPVVVGNVPIL